MQHGNGAQLEIEKGAGDIGQHCHQKTLQQKRCFALPACNLEWLVDRRLLAFPAGAALAALRLHGLAAVAARPRPRTGVGALDGLGLRHG